MVIFRSFFKISQWNLVSTWVMGLIAHIMMHDIICDAVIELWQKITEKNGQMNVRIVKSQEEMGKIHSNHDTWLPALKICLYEIFRWPLTWTRYRSKVRKYSKCYFALNFFQIFTKFGREDHNGELLEPSWNIFWSDLTWLGHVTLNYSVRSLYIEKLEFRLDLCISKQALVHQAKKAGSNHYFMIWPLDLWPMFTIRSHVFKGLYLQNGDP